MSSNIIVELPQNNFLALLPFIIAAIITIIPVRRRATTRPGARRLVPHFFRLPPLLPQGRRQHTQAFSLLVDALRYRD